MSKTITKEYQQLNEQLHNSNETYPSPKAEKEGFCACDSLKKLKINQNKADIGDLKPRLQENMVFILIQFMILKGGKNGTRNDGS